MQIYIAHYVIEHGSIGLEEEHWVLKETEKSNEIVSNEGSLVQKEASIDRLKVKLSDLFGVTNIVESNDVSGFVLNSSVNGCGTE